MARHENDDTYSTLDSYPLQQDPEKPVIVLVLVSAEELHRTPVKRDCNGRGGTRLGVIKRERARQKLEVPVSSEGKVIRALRRFETVRTGMQWLSK